MRICQQCRKELTGKQRRFCSDACRMKFTRAKARGEQPEQDPFGLFVNRSPIVPKSLDFGNKRTFTVTVTVRFSSDQPAGEWDQGLINEYLRARLAKIIQMVLFQEHADWQIRVEVASKYNGRG